MVGTLALAVESFYIYVCYINFQMNTNETQMW